MTSSFGRLHSLTGTQATPVEARSQSRINMVDTTISRSKKVLSRALPIELLRLLPFRLMYRSASVSCSRLSFPSYPFVTNHTLSLYTCVHFLVVRTSRQKLVQTKNTSFRMSLAPNSRKRTRPGELTTSQVVDLMKTLLPETMPLLSNGALEGLRRAHEVFLHEIACELAKSESKGPIQPGEVGEILCHLGYAELATEALTKVEACAISFVGEKRVSKKKKSQQKWTAIMEAEQEKLLEQSRHTMVGDNKRPV